jgi:hypothetical protein
MWPFISADRSAQCLSSRVSGRTRWIVRQA